MEENNTYTIDEIRQFGLNDERFIRENAKVFVKDNRVYFFEEIDSDHLRLYSVISKKSFFL